MRASVDWSRVDHVLLDMDGTVLDLAFDNYFWGEVVPQAYADSRELSFEQAAAVLDPHFESLRGTLAWYSLSHWSRLTGLDLTALKCQHRERIAPVPGAEAFLDGLERRGLRPWVVTNADPAVLDIKLLHTGLAGRFEHIVSSHALDAPKEDPAFWSRLRRDFPHDPARALFVDDSLPVLTAASAAGIGQVIGIRWPDSRRPPRDIPGVPSVDRLGDLLPVPARRA